MLLNEGQHFFSPLHVGAEKLNYYASDMSQMKQNSILVNLVLKSGPRGDISKTQNIMVIVKRMS